MAARTEPRPPELSQGGSPTGNKGQRGPRSHVRRRPRARSGRKSGQGRDRRPGGTGARGFGRSTRRITSRLPCSASGQTDAGGGFGLEAPRTPSRGLAQPHRLLRLDGPGGRARFWAGLGRVEPRRPAARGRYPALSGAGGPRQARGSQRPPGCRRRGPRRKDRPGNPSARLGRRFPSGRTRPMGCAPGRGQRRPTTRGSSSSPASAATSPSASPSTTPAMPASTSSSRQAARLHSTSRKQPLRSSRPRSSKAAC